MSGDPFRTEVDFRFRYWKAVALDWNENGSDGPPTALVEYALQWTLVWVAGAHAAASDAATRVALENVGSAVFTFWDVFYNSLIYWLEGGYLLLFSVVIVKAGVFRRAIGWFGILAAAYQFFNTASIPLGVPDALTLPGNLLLAAWFVVVSVSLLRMKG